MYNQEQKERFLNDFYYNNDTKRMTSYTFEKSAVLEERYDTDLCKFNQNQLADVLSYFDCPTENALGKYFNQVKQYVKWSTEQGYCSHNLAFSNIFRRDLKKYINLDAVKNQYIRGRKELYELCDILANPVDQALLILFYEGLNGEEMTEVRNLKKEDVKIIAKEIIIRGENSRILTNVDERSIAILEEAINENEYLVNNGESTAKAPKRYMIDSDYVIRPTKMHNLDGEAISVAGINVKFDKIKKWLGKYYMNSTNLFYSGVFERIQKAEETKGSELNVKDYGQVLEDIGMKPETYGTLKERYETFRNNK